MNKPNPDKEQELKALKDKIADPKIQKSIDDKLKYINKPIRK